MQTPAYCFSFPAQAGPFWKLLGHMDDLALVAFMPRFIPLEHACKEFQPLVAVSFLGQCEDECP
jgi:hypothetical protein